MDPTTIKCKPDGPYLVTGLADLRDSKGAPIATEPVVALCRCGGSSKKPFCDGTHKKNGFSGARVSDGSADARDDYRGREITIHDNRAICAHSGICTDRLAAVFKYGSDPWIDPDGAAAAFVIAAVDHCPSGALSYSIGGTERPPRARACHIKVTKDGPYAVEGDVRLLDQPLAEGAATDRLTLCRCGGSKNKPFCDGSHWDLGFKDGA